MMQQPIAELETLSAPRRRRPFVWVLGGVAVVALVAGALALAGGGDDPESAAVVLSEAQARTTGNGTARITVIGHLTIGGQTTKFLDGEGESDFGAKAARVKMAIGPITEEFRSVNDVVYIQVSSVDLPRGAHWVALTASDVKIDSAASSAMSSGDPSSGLQFLSAVTGDPRVIGKEQVDGIDVTHYEFTLDFKTFFDQIGDASEQLNAPSFAEELKALDSLIDIRSIPGQAWIDSDGRVRKFEIKIEADADGQTVKMVEEFTFSHFDEPVKITAPPASDTIPFREVPDLFSRIAESAAAAATTG